MLSTTPLPIQQMVVSLTAPRKKKCSPLEDTAQQIRYQNVSQTKLSYFTKRSTLSDDNAIKSQLKRVQNARNCIPRSKSKDVPILTQNCIGRIRPDDVKSRQISIDFVFRHVFHSPEEEKWEDLKVIPTISDMFCIPHGSWKSVQKILIQSLKAYNHELDDEETSGSRGLIKRGSKEDQIILKCVMQQLPIVACWEEVNLWRKIESKNTLSWSTVQRHISSHPLIVTNKRKKQKSGSSEEESAWARARLAQCQQWLYQLRLGLGEVVDIGTTTLTPPFPPIFTDGIAWWDENYAAGMEYHDTVLECSTNKRSYY